MLRIVENLGEFVYESVPEHTILKCRITRNRKGVDKGSHKFYNMHYNSNKSKDQQRCVP